MVHKAGKTMIEESENEKPQVFEKKQAQYKDLSKKFVNMVNDYSKQFAHIYAIRLAELRNVLIPRVKAKWGIFCYLIFLYSYLYSFYNNYNFCLYRKYSYCEIG